MVEEKIVERAQGFGLGSSLQPLVKRNGAVGRQAELRGHDGENVGHLLPDWILQMQKTAKVSFVKSHLDQASGGCVNGKP